MQRSSGAGEAEESSHGCGSLSSGRKKLVGGGISRGCARRAAASLVPGFLYEPSLYA